ncbi:MAG TPA: CHRD domain-containing protein [Rhizomicrobium sp.]|nr:CHRD domain-containing protein [Rhizomicrobium sp.]
MIWTMFARLTACALVLAAVPALAATTYQANLGPMPLDAANKANMLGRGEVTATWDGKALTVTGTFGSLPSPATAAHLMIGLGIGVPGTESLDLTISQAGDGTVSGTLPLNAKQQAAFRTGKMYVQIDSQKAPTGTLWGWLLPQHQDAPPDVPQAGPWFLPQLDTPTH